MITDGLITDIDETIDTVIECSYLPMSIVIVGVGNAKFDKLDILDDDEGTLVNSNGKRPLRDCVQFVQFNTIEDVATLRKEILCEIPEQISAYYEH